MTLEDQLTVGAETGVAVAAIVSVSSAFDKRSSESSEFRRLQSLEIALTVLKYFPAKNCRGAHKGPRDNFNVTLITAMLAPNMKPP